MIKFKPLMPNIPFLICVGGIMGSGKTTLGQQLWSRVHSRKQPVRFVDIDDISRDITYWMSQESQSYPDDKTIWQTFTEFVSRCTSFREPIILSGTLRDYWKRDQLMQLAHTEGYMFQGIFYNLEPETVIPRAIKRAKDSNGHHLLQADEATQKILDWKQKFDDQEHPDLSLPNWTVITDDSLSVSDILYSLSLKEPYNSLLNDRFQFSDRERML